ncbi:helix-turn-helix domain-containing protein [Streptomyces virginiae]|uniref:helix-turn-helix domain-containing protein n=1 Tax=Streptomyces virginiae TaxID=1961 RepID=UPI00225865A6|nr:helix-turn-helix domain-containing protein [Streptomyces virginiae]MCX5270986.1 helix-turn-helix domain-containing protein [Streptomyces virginiae]
MDHTSVHEPVGVIGERTRQLRQRKGWTAAELGDRMSDLGVKWDRSIVANLENGRRKSVSVGELLGLAMALDVAPVHILIPPSGGRYKPAPNAEYDAGAVREWVRGHGALPGTDLRIFRSEAPEEEWSDSDLPERAQEENDVTRHLLAGVQAARRAGLTEEQVLAWIRGAWQLSDAFEKETDVEH